MRAFNLEPEQIAQWLMAASLIDLVKLQTLLLQQGVEFHIAPSPVAIVQQTEEPS